MWYACQLRNSPQQTKMTQKFTTIGHRTVYFTFCQGEMFVVLFLCHSVAVSLMYVTNNPEYLKFRQKCYYSKSKYRNQKGTI